MQIINVLIHYNFKGSNVHLTFHYFQISEHLPLHKSFSLRIFIQTRMHSSGMRTAHCSGHLSCHAHPPNHAHTDATHAPPLPCTPPLPYMPLFATHAPLAMLMLSQCMPPHHAHLWTHRQVFVKTLPFSN